MSDRITLKELNYRACVLFLESAAPEKLDEFRDSFEEMYPIFTADMAIIDVRPDETSSEEVQAYQEDLTDWAPMIIYLAHLFLQPFRHRFEYAEWRYHPGDELDRILVEIRRRGWFPEDCLEMMKKTVLNVLQERHSFRNAP